MFPALEVALRARSLGWEVGYVGSLRGVEGRECEKRDIPFQGYPTEPIMRMASPQGVAQVLRSMRATGRVLRSLRNEKPNVVFCTGGYSAAPLVQAARLRKVPFVIHEQNSVPGRVNAMNADAAYRFATTFHATAANVPHARAERTGLPIREALRQAAEKAQTVSKDTILILGGSQGSRAINEVVPKAARQVDHLGARWVHVTGPGGYEAVLSDPTVDQIPNYEVAPYLSAEQIAAELSRARLAVGRSGSTLAEYAAFRVPSVLIPLPNSAKDHQLHNALEFVEIGAATLIRQDEMTPERLATAIAARWESAPDDKVSQTLAEWDMPHALDRLMDLIQQAASQNSN